MFEIDYKFNPGETVFVIDRTEYAIHEGVVYNVVIKSFMEGDTLTTKIDYAITIKANHEGIHAFETEVFETYQDAYISLYRTPTPSATRTITPTPTLSRTPTRMATRTPTPSPTLTPTLTATMTPSNAASPTPTSSVTPTLTPTRSTTVTPTHTPSATAAVTPTLTPTRSASPTPTVTATRTPTVTASVTPTRTGTPAAPSATPSVTPTGTPGVTPSPTVTATVTPTPSSALADYQATVLSLSPTHYWNFDATDLDPPNKLWNALVGEEQITTNEDRNQDGITAIDGLSMSWDSVGGETTDRAEFVNRIPLNGPFTVRFSAYHNPDTYEYTLEAPSDYSGPESVVPYGMLSTNVNTANDIFSPNAFSVYIVDSNGDEYQLDSDAGAIPVYEWTNFTITKDASNVVTAYINDTPLPTTVTVPTGMALWAFGSTYTDSDIVTNNVDELIIYNYALSPAQIANLNALAATVTNARPAPSPTPTPTVTPSVTPSAAASEPFLAIMAINDTGTMYVRGFDSVAGFTALEQDVTTIFPDTGGFNKVAVKVGNTIHIVSYDETFATRTLESFPFDENGLNLAGKYPSTPLDGSPLYVNMFDYNGKLMLVTSGDGTTVNYKIYDDTGTGLTLSWSQTIDRGFTARSSVVGFFADGSLFSTTYNDTNGDTYWEALSNPSGTEFVVDHSEMLGTFVGPYVNDGNLIMLPGPSGGQGDMDVIIYDPITGFGDRVTKLDPTTFFPYQTVFNEFTTFGVEDKIAYYTYRELVTDIDHVIAFTYDTSGNLTIETDDTAIPLAAPSSRGRMITTCGGRCGYGYANFPIDAIRYTGTNFVLLNSLTSETWFNMAPYPALIPLT